ncbi:hypothetical protein RND81_01G159500 [Saponaria officinalis]|uniref:Uncharacterized protein n=1 Tax=Saponaria officinalis TaxID=3572 RepID=A0AAW1N7X8_SAPOF
MFLPGRALARGELPPAITDYSRRVNPGLLLKYSQSACNYLEYVRREKNAAEAFVLKHINSWVVSIYCHKVIRLSAATQELPRSVICNVHGVNPKFLGIGRVMDIPIPMLSRLSSRCRVMVAEQLGLTERTKYRTRVFLADWLLACRADWARVVTPITSEATSAERLLPRPRGLPWPNGYLCGRVMLAEWLFQAVPEAERMGRGSVRAGAEAVPTLRGRAD